MGLSPALQLIPDDAFDTSVPTPQYSADFASIVGNAGDSSDGFDAIFSVLADHLSSGPGALTGLDSALADIGAVGDPASIPFEQDFASSLSATITQGQPDFDAFAVHLTGDQPPASGGATTSTPSSNCSQRSNQYGLSTAGAFTGVRCDLKNIFQVLRVQDGPCTYSAAPAAQAGANALPGIVSFTLTSGDSTVWKLGHHTEKASDGTPFDVYDVAITPKLLPAKASPAPAISGAAKNPTPAPTQNPSHFDATGALVLSNPSRTLNVCMSVDCIP